MDVSTQALLSTILSASALIISVLSVLRSRKNHLSGTLSSQRMIWAENLRDAVNSFITAMYNGEELAPYRAHILLYLSRGNPSQKQLVDVLQLVCSPAGNSMSLDEKCDKLVVATQDVVRENWWMVKAELGLLPAEEAHRDANFEKLKDKRSPK